MRTSRISLWATSSLGAALVCACLVLVNLIARRVHVRVDASDGRLYSLSAGSKRILRGLEIPIEARVYFSKELPPEYATVHAYLRDLLAEYEDASRGMLRVRFADVDADVEAKREAIEAGIAPLQFNAVTQEKFEVREGFMGMVFQQEGQREAIPVVASTIGLEYDLTSRILQLSRPKKAVLGIITSHGAMGPEMLSSGMRQILERNYTIVPVDLAAPKNNAVPSAINALLLLGPTLEFDTRARYALDQYLMSGRPLTAALDPRRTNIRTFLSSPGDKGLREQFSAYGVRIDSTFVLDKQNRSVQVAQNRGFMTFTNVVPFPLFILVRDLNGDHAVTRHLDSVTFPFAAALSTTAASGRVHILARSSRYSWQRAAWKRGIVHSVNPMQDLDPVEKDPIGPFPLAMSLEGPFNSLFSGEGAPAKPKGVEQRAFIARGPEEGRLLVIGTARIASPEMPVGGAAAALLLNAVDWMALDNDLIAIRSKTAMHRPLREIPTRAKTLTRWVNILLPGFLVAAFGAFRLSRKSKARARRRVLYSVASRDDESIA